MLGKQGGSGQQNPVIIIVLAVVIAAAAFMVYRTMNPSRPADQPGPGSMMPGMGGPPGAMPGPPGAMPGPPGTQPGPGVAPGVQPGGPGAVPPPGAAPGAAPAPAPGPAPAPQAAPAQRSSAPAVPATQPGPQVAMQRMTVFGNVNVSYPSTWKISASGGNAAAIFTDGKAFFEVRPPDPKATTAQAIAQAAVKSLGGAKVTGEGAGKVGRYDSYWMIVSHGSGTARVTGVDASTRVVLIERVRGGQFSAYAGTFDKIKAEMSFGG